MESKVLVGLILVVMVGLFCSSEAYVFTVGGKDGWTRHPSEGYNQWAGRYRFQVNDSLLFKYRKGADSVLVVKRDDYASCNTKSPIASLTNGDSLFILDRSGPFFFISGNSDKCNDGQKMIVVVLAQRDKAPTPQPPPHSPAPATPPHPGTIPPPAVPSPAAASPPHGADPTGPKQDPPAPAPSLSFAPAGCSFSGAVVLGFSGIASYMVLGKVLV